MSSMSQTSFWILFAQFYNKAKHAASFFMQGIYKLFEYTRKLKLNDLADTGFSTLNVSLNFNILVDNSSNIFEIFKQKEVDPITKKCL